ncbi:ribosomal-protein-alanine N-acetyltransferase [Lysinibacillus sphaericus]|uniref:[Ribosomal protein bS18]-alanine N-acetyltransferase n=2 Tax=Lysinibacillus TaxID=400634 RepID=A0A2S5CTQ9_LYSSH|nr:MULTISPECIES: ribosomal protein S18-alanine N-acetyltransferase [Lysinibacillus]AVK95269.1 ribosomal-protein-alanine N-acetyltransferase RimI [Lysinibacillus sphaericus]MCS1382984.1 ribosomal protein S18-alanine N-acetyltransferase [Lysinibacillus sphaericus]MED4542058.1 ribosomal protein S18-alanine N-acetyltransferase [Lysinibacillus sphaericus]OEC02249.1 alanine acetyltransferase [Lysinibacillus sphaericus]POZ54184.1 Ribosomal-protein-alanine acetyltransferase [Lysinibacillus sphaericus]
MSSNIVYRKMVSEDVPAVYAIELATFPTPWTLDSFYYEMHENQYAHYVLAVDENNTIIGFCGMWMVIDAAQITNVAVLETARGQGIGEGLMREAMRIAREHGMDVMSLEVRETNTVAQNLYRKLAFQDGGIRKGYYTDNGEDALVMWVNL